jgi:hypothetical protein
MEFSDYICYKSENVKKNKSGLAVRKMKDKNWNSFLGTFLCALVVSCNTIASIILLGW